MGTAGGIPAAIASGIGSGISAVSAIAAIAAGIALSLLLGLFPLLDGLTYEYACAVALAALAASIAAGSRLGRSLEDPHALRFKLLARAPRERIEPAAARALAALVLGVLAAALAPALRGALDGCAWERGLPVYLYVALPPVPLGLGAGVAARAWAPRSFRQRAALLVSLLLGSAALTLRELLAGPRAVLHNLVLGVVSSTGYLGFDPTVRLDAPALLHRAAALVLAGLLLALAVARGAARGRPAPGHDPERVRLLLAVERRRASRRALAAALLLAALAAAGDATGFGSGRSTLERTLSARHESEHFVLRFRPGSRAEALRLMLADDCEWAHARLAPTLAPDDTVRPVRPARTTVFIYEDEREQEALTGSSGYLFAKPWRGELHTRLEPSGELRSFPHELAHVLAARFGLPLLGVSVRYGLIEGLAEGVAAEYAERPWRHEPVAAALRAGLLPRARDAVGSLGFAGRDPHASYLAAASFCGFLLERFGPARLREVYAWGDFERAYGASLEALDAQWREFLRSVPVGPRALEVASRAFDPAKAPPFFRRACARLGLRSPAPAPPDCDRPWACGEAEGPRFEASLADLDAASAAGPPLARDASLASLAAALAAAGRDPEAAAAIARRLELGFAPREAWGPLRAAAADPSLAARALALTGALPLDSPRLLSPTLAAAAPANPGDLPEPAPAIVRAAPGWVLDLALARLGGPGPALAPEALGIGACSPGLEGFEARLLVRLARDARRQGAAARSLALAENARSLEGADDDARRDAELEVERSSTPWRSAGGAPAAGLRGSTVF